MKMLRFSTLRYGYRRCLPWRHVSVAAACMLISLLTLADSGRLYTSNELTSSLTNCVGQDHYGYIWVGTENGLNKFDGYRFTQYIRNNVCDKDPASLLSNDVSKAFTDREGRLWIGCDQGLMQYDYQDDSFKTFPFPDKLTPRVEDIIQTAGGDILLATAGYGLFSIKAGTDVITKENIPGWKTSYEFVNRLFIDRNNDIWMSMPRSRITRMHRSAGGKITFKDFKTTCGPTINCIDMGRGGFLVVCMYGIMKYDYATGRLTDTGYDMSLLNRNVSIRRGIADRKGNIYIGTSGSGLMTIPAGSKTLVQAKTKDKSFDLSTSNVNDIFEDKDGNIWVSCYKRGIYLLNQDKEAFSSWDFTSQKYFLGSGVSSIAAGNDGDIWVTVQKAGVYKFDKSGNVSAHPNSPYGSNTIYRDGQGRFWLCTENSLYAYDPYTGLSEEKARYDGWGLNCMTDDGRGRLFFCNYGKGLCVYDTRSGKSLSFSMEDRRRHGTICNNWIKALFIDSDGRLWIGSANGVSCMDTSNYHFITHNGGTMLRNMQSLSFGETHEGRILIGTNNGLYEYDKVTKRLRLFPGSQMLRNNSIYGIVIDNSNDIWLSTARGIMLYDRHEGQFISHVRGNGLSTYEYIIGAALHSDDTDRIAFGTNDGVTVFSPDEVKSSTLEMDSIYLTNFIVNGKPVYSFRDSFTVPYNSNTLQLEFSLLNFKHTGEIRFQYRVNGSEEWITVSDGTNTLRFNELKPGRYDICVRAECNGKYSRQTKKITVIVKNPWYSSTMAWIIYVFVIVSAVVYAIRQYEKNKREELDEAKMRFLINATHDIRSPLTLILGPLNKLKQKITSKECLEDIDTIDRNAQRLLLLVNQILDERRIDKNQMHLHCQNTELGTQISGVMAMFQSNARQRGISLRLVSEGKVYAWVDRTNFDKIIQNLLSNSFKFTPPDGGDICIMLRYEGNGVVIQVQDTGTGFADENTERLFDRFYQGTNTTGMKTIGTGIGLNLCRTLIQMHGGKIKAANRSDGRQGALVTITLRTGNAHLKPEEIVTGTDASCDAGTGTPRHRHASKNYHIMIVDDDPEIAAYIRRELGEWYRLDSFANGKDALRALLSEQYDLVVSDIVMPVMDGIAMLKSIRTNSLISDIPVILLTSKADAADRLEGFKRGADAYLPKPFDIGELRVMIDNLVDKTRRLKGKYSGAQAQENKVEKIKVKGNNDALMERIMKSINKKISNPDFNVEELTGDVGISRAQLHRKMKEITGISAGEFIRNLRLEQAARLICEGKINITQVAYNVGFNNQTHFSTVFKKHFGMSPSEYAEKHKPAGGGES